MTIKPPDADGIKRIIDVAYGEFASHDKKEQSFKSLKSSEQQRINKLCYFLSFYICEEISERVQQEVDGIVTALRTVVTKLKPEDQEKVASALCNLRHLKGGGLIPGERIFLAEMPKYIYQGAPVICRKSPMARFMVKTWEPDLSAIHLQGENGELSVPLSQLIFVEKKQAQPSVEQASS